MVAGNDITIDPAAIQNCPFCDDFDGIFTDWEDRIGNYHFVGCYGCCVSAPSCLDKDMQKAVDGSIVKWNFWGLLVKISGIKLEDLT